MGTVQPPHMTGFSREPWPRVSRIRSQDKKAKNRRDGENILVETGRLVIYLLVKISYTKILNESAYFIT